MRLRCRALRQSRDIGERTWRRARASGTLLRVLRPPKWSYTDPAVLAYCADHTTGPDGVLARLVATTAEVAAESASLQVAPEQGVLLTMLCRLARARLAVELGTFTGYSSICIARGLAPGGRLLTCDTSREWTDVARRFWEEAGVTDRIELRLTSAMHLLRTLPADPVVDFAFVDADKGRLADYYAELLPRLRPGGLLVVDNTLWGGRVLDPDDEHPWTAAIAAFNDAAAADPRVEVVLLPVADGMTLLRKLDVGQTPGDAP